MSFANYSISFSNEFEITRVVLTLVIGVVAVSSNILCMFFTIRQSSALSSEYVKVLLILKIFQLAYDVQTCFFFIVTPLFPCKGHFMRGIGVYLVMDAHISLVIHLTLLSMICAWFNCCLFHRHQVILPFDHPAKLQPRAIYSVYLLMNFVMIFNPISFIFTTKNDQEAQRPIIANSPMAWLLTVPSYKIYTEENCPVVVTYHFTFLLLLWYVQTIAQGTFALCTLTTTILTKHAARIMNARREQISAATVVMQQRLINSLQFQMNVTTFGMGFPTVFWSASILIGFTLSRVTAMLMLFLPSSSCCNSVYAIVSTKSSVDFILGALRIRKRRQSVKPRASMTAFTVSPNNGSPISDNRRF